MSMKLTCGEFVGLAYANDDELREFAEEILAENAKLREELEQWHRLAAGIELPEYPITEFKPKDLEHENTELRELVRWMYDRMDESCAVQYPYAPTPISYDRLMQAQARARELGVEVDE